jgi:hypothetical protein
VGFIDDLVSEHVHDISLLVNFDVRKDILLCKHIQKVGYNLLHHPRRFTFVVIHRTYCLQPLIRRLTSEEWEDTFQPIFFGVELKLFDMGLAEVSEPAWVKDSSSLFELNDLFDYLSLGVKRNAIVARLSKFYEIKLQMAHWKLELPYRTLIEGFEANELDLSCRGDTDEWSEVLLVIFDATNMLDWRLEFSHWPLRLISIYSKASSLSLPMNVHTCSSFASVPQEQLFVTYEVNDGVNKHSLHKSLTLLLALNCLFQDIVRNKTLWACLKQNRLEFILISWRYTL